MSVSADLSVSIHVDLLYTTLLNFLLEVQMIQEITLLALSPRRVSPGTVDM